MSGEDDVGSGSLGESEGGGVARGGNVAPEVDPQGKALERDDTDWLDALAIGDLAVTTANEQDVDGEGVQSHAQFDRDSSSTSLCRMRFGVTGATRMKILRKLPCFFPMINMGIRIKSLI